MATGEAISTAREPAKYGKAFGGLFVVVRMTGITEGGDRKGTVSEWKPMSKADICECTE